MNRSDESATAPLGLGFILACAMLFIGGQALGEQPVLANEKLLDVVAKANRGNRNELRAMLHAFKRPGAVQVSKDALPELVRVLKEDDAELQLLAAHGLYALKIPQSKDALVQFLGKKDFRKLEKKAHAGEISERSYESQLRASSLAILTLGEIGDKSVIPLLQSLRSFKDLKFEWGGGPVEQALAKLGSEGLKTLCTIGPDADDEKINKASQAVAQIRDPKRIPELVATVGDGMCAGSIRFAALSALAGMRDADTLPFILDTMRDPGNPQHLRAAAAVLAGRSRKPQAEEVLLKTLDKPASDIRPHCLIALAWLNPEQYVPRILAEVLDKSVPLLDREQLAWDLSRSLSGSPGSPQDPFNLKKHRDGLVLGLKALKDDDKPADLIRARMWRALHTCTGEEAKLELLNEKVAYAELDGLIRRKVVQQHRNVGLSVAQEDGLVKDRIAAIVVKWQPEGGGQPR